MSPRVSGLNWCDRSEPRRLYSTCGFSSAVVRSSPPNMKIMRSGNCFNKLYEGYQLNSVDMAVLVIAYAIGAPDAMAVHRFNGAV